MLKNKFEFTLSALLLAICAVVGINAAGPLNMWNKEQRIPYRWDVSTPVPIYTDIGPFEVLPPNPPAGTQLVTNEIADATVAFAASQWSNVPTSSMRAQVVGDFAMKGLPDVKDAATAAQVIGAGAVSPIHRTGVPSSREAVSRDVRVRSSCEREREPPAHSCR